MKTDEAIRKAREAAAEIMAEPEEEIFDDDEDDELPVWEPSELTMAGILEDFEEAAWNPIELQVRHDRMCFTANEDEHLKGLVVDIPMIEGEGFRVKKSVKRLSNPPEYFSTYDGETDTDGNPWGSPSEAYPTVDLVFTLALPNGNHPRGTLVSFTPEAQGFLPWVTFYKQVEAAGLLGQTVRAKISPQTIYYKGRQKMAGIFEME